MVILKLLIYFLSLLLPGYLILSLIFKQNIKSFWQKLSLSYGLGSFIITMQLFLFLFIFQLSFSKWFYAVFIIENLFLIYFAHRKKVLFIRLNFSFLKQLKTKEVIIVLLIVVQLIFLFSNALSRPAITYDSMAMWTFKAKTLFYENKVNFNPDSYLYLGGGWHKNYPWHVPLMQFWLFSILNEFNDLLSNFIFTFYFIGLIVACYYFLRDYISSFKSLLFVFFLSTMPFVFYHGFNAYADLVLNYYIFIFFVFLYKWFKNKDKNYLILSSIFASMSFFVKNEAIIFIIAGFIVLVLHLFINSVEAKVKIKKLFNYMVFVILPVFPWIIFKAVYNLGIRNMGSDLGFYPEVFKSFFTVIFLSNSWNIWWYIVFIALIINFKKIIKDKGLLLGWVFLFLSFFGFLILYLFTKEHQYAVYYTAIGCNILTIVPVSVFITAILYQHNKGSKNIC